MVNICAMTGRHIIENKKTNKNMGIAGFIIPPHSR
jgi:hypothetical protein